MESNKVVLPGVRDVRATIDLPDGEANAVTVACPPHPEFGGNRSDNRLVALGEVLAERGVACLRFDYGEWDEGYGEREDARNALRWARERHDRVGVFGFSFGGGVAALAGADEGADAIALLAPASRLAEDLDAVAALDAVEVPLKVVYGTRDDTANWKPLVERAEELGFETEAFGADHFFVGQERKVAGRVGEFLVEHLG
ncbi:alpha/beta hydrolase [Haladaptatus salinisoli]|uniref:alpha/beta hydrolase n=1 Tax=Haladaptatus salinisoli TaxID=2884876 RepID=UPI001D0A199F|nr:alpha/beta hydrolase [Haladaptatus salinisoli]